jgi:Rps23 Pro-64 3,4-dihydroxylase Tpa1-like proline 4-hydroxylase
MPIGAAHMDQLLRVGYVVLDHAVSAHTARAIRAEVGQLAQGKMLFRNSTRLVRLGRVQEIEKIGVWEQEMSDDKVQRCVPHLHQYCMNSEVMHQLNHGAKGKFDLVRQDVKVQVNVGNGACFPMHADSDGTVDDRKITAIVYLNEEWEEGDGGELRLYPFPFQPVDIRPIFGRMVIFSSVNMLHRVLPSVKPRYCFTMWLSGSIAAENSANPGCVDSSHTGELERVLLSRPDLRLLLAKVIYAREWADSITESHLASEALQGALDQHWKDIGTISQALFEYIPFVSQNYPIREEDFDDSKRISWF